LAAHDLEHASFLRHPGAVELLEDVGERRRGEKNRHRGGVRGSGEAAVAGEDVDRRHAGYDVADDPGELGGGPGQIGERQ